MAAKRPPRARRPIASPWLRPAALVAIALLSNPGCSPAPPPPPLEVEFSGCETVLRGPVCVTSPWYELKLWIRSDPEATITIDGRPPAGPTTAVQQGLRCPVDRPAEPHLLAVESRRGRASARWTLALTPSRRPSWHLEANRLAGAGDFARATEVLEPQLASASPLDRGLAAGTLARIVARTGDGERAEELLSTAIAAHHEAGDLYRELNDGLLLFDLLLPRRDFVAARRLLASLPAVAGYATAGFRRSINLGLLAHRTGDLRTAQNHFAAALELGERLGIVDGRNRVLIEESQTLGLQRLGRLAEAAARLDGLPEAGLNDPCDRARLLNNRGWGLLLGEETGQALGDPEPSLAAALALFDESCRILDERRNVRVNLALARLHRGDLAGARRRLGEAEALSPDRPLPNLLLWAWDIEARIRLAEARPRDALALYDELSERARELESPEAEWRVAFWRAQAREAAGDAAGALDDYAQAEELLERQQLLAPMHVGRDTFVAQRGRATRRHLELLLRQGRDAEALGLVRRARGRYLASIRRFTSVAGLADDDRETWDRLIADYQIQRLELDDQAAAAWRLPGDRWRAAQERRHGRRRELQDRLDRMLAMVEEPASRPAAHPPPPPGELLLAYHPLDHGWVGLAADRDGVVARRLGSFDPERSPPEELAAHLLEPFAARLQAARKVRVLAHGPLWGVDFHALPFAGGTLLDGRSVVYSLDLPPRPGAGTASRTALLVADPEGDLPGARREADRVARLLRPRFTVDRLAGAEATGPAVRRRLAGSDLFHYAGHGVSAGWNSHLPLAGESGLTVDDIVVLDPAPGLVVLSGCETAAIPADLPAEGMGLAHAFLVAGAQAVVATVRRVPDPTAGALIEEFYRQLAAGEEPAEALRRAQLARAETNDDPGWASFRIIEP